MASLNHDPLDMFGSGTEDYRDVVELAEIFSYTSDRFGANLDEITGAAIGCWPESRIVCAVDIVYANLDNEN